LINDLEEKIKMKTKRKLDQARDREEYNKELQKIAEEDKTAMKNNFQNKM